MVLPKTYFCPAKINLFLAITGRREDGFHALVSLVAPLTWGDDLDVAPSADGSFSLTCDDAEVPIEGNLVLTAAHAFGAAVGWRGGARFHLRKRIPMGAGLGGGSSDAATALRALNDLADRPLSRAQLQRIAATVGSDCPLFLEDGPVIMRGRGELIEPLAPAAAQRLVGQRVLVFKPPFSINTAWAYGALAKEAPASYLADPEAEALLQAWLNDSSALPAALGFNSLERPAFAKFFALPVMLAMLQERHGISARMSGSGSACYAFIGDEVDLVAIQKTIREGWGTASVCETANICLTVS